MSEASGSTFPGAMPAVAKNATGSLSVLRPWCVTVSTRTVCPDLTRRTGARSAAIQPQLTVAGVDGKCITDERFLGLPLIAPFLGLRSHSQQAPNSKLQAPNVWNLCLGT